MKHVSVFTPVLVEEIITRIVEGGTLTEGERKAYLDECCGDIPYGFLTGDDGSIEDHFFALYEYGDFISDPDPFDSSCRMI